MIALENSFHVDFLPKLKKPMLIAGFGGWGNALNVSKGMVGYLIRKFQAKNFATPNTDLFYRFDETRPVATINNGYLKSLEMPGGRLFFSTPPQSDCDLILFETEEPNLRWNQFVAHLIDLCKKLEVTTIITLGSMWDNVLHTDYVVSGIASNESLWKTLEPEGVIPIHYQGPSSINSLIIKESAKRGLQCASLWSHCPYYLQGSPHYGLMAHLGRLLSKIGGFELDTQELSSKWEKMLARFQDLIQKDPNIQEVVRGMRKAKVKGMVAMQNKTINNGNLINLKDFLNS
jgi:proteasome assembly chaperone (PAC2) family protein